MTEVSLNVDQHVRPPEEPVLTAKQRIRPDIQALRGIAILWVVLHHIRMPGVPGGFLGVDIFFVISGFLMTGLIDEALTDGHFTLKSFYTRRVRRIFPAAYVTVTITAIAAAFLIDSSEYRALVNQIVGTFTFTANFILWQQTDYFGSGADLKPLLHTWSLSIEEQFYIFLPVILMMLNAKWRLPATLALTLGSLALCLLLQPRMPTATFYLLPTRAWELGIGSVIALMVRRGQLPTAPLSALRLICAATLIVVPLLVDEAGHPGLPALAVCVATAILLIPGADSPSLAKGLSPLTWVGDRSYSLYLVHWPLLAFAYNIYLDHPPVWLTIALVVPMLVWTELQYRFVEQTLRRFPINAWTMALLFAIPLAVVGGSYAWSRHASAGAPDRAANFGLSRACEYSDSFAPRPACTTGPVPTILVWGDSFAMHVAPGLAASTTRPMLQMTRTFCGPFLGYAPLGATRGEAWADSCMRFNDAVIDHLRRTPAITTVVISSSLAQYIPGGDRPDPIAVVRQGDSALRVHATPERLAAALDRSVTAIRAAGKRVIFVGPPPTIGIDMSRCADRHRLGLWTIGGNAECAFTDAEYRAARAPILAFLAIVEKRQLVPILHLDKALCRDGVCRTTLDGTALYRDHAHLSISGSRLLGQRMQWERLVDADAR